MDPASAFNQSVMVKVLPKGSTQPGWTYVGISPQKVEAISLVTGEGKVLYEVTVGGEIAVNSVSSGTRFRGVAATGHLFLFAERAGADQISLVVCGFSGKLPIERPMTIDGTVVMGPVLSDELVALCSPQAVGIYDLRNKKSVQMQLPSSFEPLLVRKQGGLHLPLGSIPLSAVRGAAGLEAWIGGEEYGIPGFLIAEVELKRWRFERTPREATVSNNLDGTLCVAAEDEIRILGTKKWKSDKVSLQAGMPATVTEEFLLAFEESGRLGRHHLSLSKRGRGTVGSLTFEDPECRGETICGTSVSSSSVGVAYLLPGIDKGLKVAHWDLEQTTQA
ncbi:hypothetical protein [Granulicella arctica]|uniref:hypothetical protein n=1 Tax=Granulicella arctica TaxID=940613 RepID=UPI0021DFC940|nr:hypothetical protein [Granulicella arctica]